MTHALRALGEELRRCREKLGIDLEELQVRTKIRKRYLMALEEGDWSILPGEVYARGFVRNYADVVGADGHALLSQFSSVQGETKTPTKSEPLPDVPGVAQKVHEANEESVVNSRKESRPSASVRPKKSPSVKPINLHRKSRGIGGGGQVAVVVGTLVVLGAGWYAVTRFNAAKHPSSPVTNVVGLTSKTTTGQQTGSTTTSGGGAAGASHTPTGNTSNVSGTPAPSQNVPVITEAPFNVASDRTVTYSVKASAPLSVALTAAKDRCWVSVSADNKIIDGSDIISTGQTKTWQAGQSMSIQVGDVPAVTLNINGQSVALPPVTRPLVVTITKSSANQ